MKINLDMVSDLDKTFRNAQLRLNDIHIQISILQAQFAPEIIEDRLVSDTMVELSRHMSILCDDMELLGLTINRAVTLYSQNETRLEEEAKLF